MKHVTAGIFAHVDSGKTSLSEALLYQTGNRRHLGRVDQGDAFLDPQLLEKKRGITIYDHQAEIVSPDFQLTIIDTPGHIDFFNQTEAAISVLDYAILVVSASDLLTSYTHMLWRLLRRHQLPVFIFVNKMDLDYDQADILAQLKADLGPQLLDFTTAGQADWYEQVAACNEQLIANFLAGKRPTDQEIAALIKKRQLFPVYFGSALKLQGTEAFFAGLKRWTQAPTAAGEFAARVFKISHDQGERLSWLRVFAGQLKAKERLATGEKINQIRHYNGSKFEVLPEAQAGDVVAVTGLQQTFPGTGLGQAGDQTAVVQPVMTYTVTSPQGQQQLLTALRELADENPELGVSWNQQLQEIRVQIMGQVEIEILQQLLAQRYHLQAQFQQGSILYKETITKAVEAVGHFEPLRHYAEAHLLMKPGTANSGIKLQADCPVNRLARNWQQQVLNDLKLKTHLGVLIGAPLTDVVITLVSGKSNLAHTVGGDFREASWRAVRQGLMELKKQQACQLLEPWYKFTLRLPTEKMGRASTDIQRMHGQAKLVASKNGMTELRGSAPVSELQGYYQTLRAYTHGQGQLECAYSGYKPCHNAEQVIAAKNYDPLADQDNTPDSVFCSHGAGHIVKWDQVPAQAQAEYAYTPQQLAQMQ